MYVSPPAALSGLWSSPFLKTNGYTIRKENMLLTLHGIANCEQVGTALFTEKLEIKTGLFEKYTEHYFLVI